MKALIVIDLLRDLSIRMGGLDHRGAAGEEIIDFVKDKIDEFRDKDYPIIYICDNHEKDDKEFDMFPPHCIANTQGSEIIEQLEAKDGGIK